MRIGIITHALIDNFGGILQAAALYNFLEEKGYEVVILQKHRNYSFPKKILSNVLKTIPFQNIKGIRKRHLQHLAHVEFIETYIKKKTKIVYTSEALDKICKESKFDAIIVGSDQVWRYEYINDGEYGAYFLNFVKRTDNLKKIAYAASFGKDYWEAPKYQHEVSNWLKDFDNISVRERSGIDICKNDFDVNAQHVVDPTLLINKSFYDRIIEKADIKTKNNKSYLLTYVLDENEEISNVINTSKKNLNIEYDFHLKGYSNKSKIYTIPEWLQAFKEAKFVITDSFHGVLFCLIFKKQFMVICNENRGRARFESILSKVNLENRIFTDNFKYEIIDYKNVDLNEFRDESIEFLLNALAKSEI